MLVQPPPPQASVFNGARAGQSCNLDLIVKSSADSNQPSSENGSILCEPRKGRGPFLAPQAIVVEQNVRKHHRLAHDRNDGHLVHLAVRPKPPVRCGRNGIHTNCSDRRHVEGCSQTYATSSDVPYSGHLVTVSSRFGDSRYQGAVLSRWATGRRRSTRAHCSRTVVPRTRLPRRWARTLTRRRNWSCGEQTRRLPGRWAMWSSTGNSGAETRTA